MNSHATKTMTKQPERIKVKITEWYKGYFDGTFEDIIAMLQDYKNEGEWEGFELRFDDYGEDGYYLYKYRLENDKEYENRIKLLEKEKERDLKRKEKEKENRRKAYEELKKEFGNT